MRTWIQFKTLSCAVWRGYLTQSVLKVVLQQSIPKQIRQLIPDISNSKGYVDGFVGEMNFAKRLEKHSL